MVIIPSGREHNIAVREWAFSRILIQHWKLKRNIGPAITHAKHKHTCRFVCTVRCRYNAVNFKSIPLKTHSIDRPLGRDIGCNSCLTFSFTFCVSQSSAVLNRVILGRVITAPNCLQKLVWNKLHVLRINIYGWLDSHAGLHFLSCCSCPTQIAVNMSWLHRHIITTKLQFSTLMCIKAKGWTQLTIRSYWLRQRLQIRTLVNWT